MLSFVAVTQVPRLMGLHPSHAWIIAVLGGRGSENTARRTTCKFLKLHPEAARALHSHLSGQGPFLPGSPQGGKVPFYRCLEAGLKRVSSPNEYCRNQGQIGKVANSLLERFSLGAINM